MDQRLSTKNFAAAKEAGMEEDVEISVGDTFEAPNHYKPHLVEVESSEEENVIAHEEQADDQPKEEQSAEEADAEQAAAEEADAEQAVQENGSKDPEASADKKPEEPEVIADKEPEGIADKKPEDDADLKPLRIQKPEDRAKPAEAAVVAEAPVAPAEAAVSDKPVKNFMLMKNPNQQKAEEKTARVEAKRKHEELKRQQMLQKQQQKMAGKSAPQQQKQQCQQQKMTKTEKSSKPINGLQGPTSLLNENVVSTDRVLKTSAYNHSTQMWERYFLYHLSMNIHTLATEELSAQETNLLHLFLDHDTGLKGRLTIREFRGVLQQMGVEPGNSTEQFLERIEGIMPKGYNRNHGFDFVTLLAWWDWEWEKNELIRDHVEMRWRFASHFTSQGPMKERLKTLTLPQLRRNVVAHKVMIRGLRQYKAARALVAARQKSGAEHYNIEQGTIDPHNEIEVLYSLLTNEFARVDHWGNLFQVFSEFDYRQKLTIKDPKVMRELFRALDVTATDEDLVAYCREANPPPSGLTFLDFLDWWQQALHNPASHLNQRARKDDVIESLKKRCGKTGWFSVWSTDKAREQWRTLEFPVLIKMCDVYHQLYRDLRWYLVELDLVRIEMQISEILAL